MIYPPEISHAAQARIEAEKIHAQSDFLSAREAIVPPFHVMSDFKLRAAIREFVIRVVRAFAHEACELGKKRIWLVSQIDDQVNRFLRQVLIEAADEKCFYGDGTPAPDITPILPSGHIAPAERNYFRTCSGWKKYQTELLEVARIQKKGYAVPLQSPGSILRLRREEAGLTQERLAELVKVSVRTVKRHEALACEIRGNNRQAYERELTKALGRPIHLLTSS